MDANLIPHRGPSLMLPVEDVQGRIDTRQQPIDRVGIKDILHPVRIRDRAQGEQHTVAQFEMTVDLPQNFKGTHMSRFVEILNQHEHEISVKSFKNMLTVMVTRLEAKTGHITMRFPYFVEKAAPVSGVRSLVDYQVSLLGEISEGQTSTRVRVLIPVTRLCPCSKAISERGAHNQRSHVTVTIATQAFVWIEELIEWVEAEASAPIYGLLKRPDEKFVTEQAYDNPKFVEDMVRDVAARLNADPRITAYVVESENFESIHNHSAYARLECNKLADQRRHS
jgi:GTP cyclohydrolase I